MNPALWAAKTGLDAQQTRMTVTSNNLANVNTNGYKKGRAVFEDLLYQNQRQVGAATSQDTQLPSGLHVGTVNIREVPGYRLELTPFGGIKDSGLGYKEGVQEAIKSFTNTKTFTFPW